jgi:hypothetical protein
LKEKDRLAKSLVGQQGWFNPSKLAIKVAKPLTWTMPDSSLGHPNPSCHNNKKNNNKKY